MKKIEARPGSKIKIEINGRREKQNSEKIIPFTRKGIIRARGQADYLPRRKKGGIFINFYDTAQFTLDGGATWYDNDFSQITAFQVSGAGYVQGVENMSAAQCEAVRDMILAVPLEDFHAAYRKLDYERAERYGIDLYLKKLTAPAANAEKEFYYPVGRNDSRPLMRPNTDETTATLISETKWTPDGLKLPAAQTEQGFNLFSAFGFNPLFSYEAATTYKITSVPDYAAPPAEFIIDKSTDFFLVPRLNIEMGRASYPDLPGSIWQNYFHAHLSREFFIDGAGYMPPSAEYQYSPFIRGSVGVIVPQSALTGAVIGYMTGRGNSRQYTDTLGPGAPVGYPFPTTPTAPDRPISLNIAHTFRDSDNGARLTEGSLLAVAKKGNEWFYFWTNLSISPTFTTTSAFGTFVPLRFLLEVSL